MRLIRFLAIDTGRECNQKIPTSCSAQVQIEMGGQGAYFVRFLGICTHACVRSRERELERPSSRSMSDSELDSWTGGGPTQPALGPRASPGSEGEKNKLKWANGSPYGANRG